MALLPKLQNIFIHSYCILGGRQYKVQKFSSCDDIHNLFSPHKIVDISNALPDFDGEC